MKNLTKRIIELVPDVGRTVNDQKHWRICNECMGGGLVCDLNGENTDVCMNCAGTGKVPNEENERIVQTRPITLADVLRAVNKMERSHMGYYMVRSNGEFATDEGYNGIGETRAYWSLTTDLDGQSEETKAFIFRILGL